MPYGAALFSTEKGLRKVTKKPEVHQDFVCLTCDVEGCEWGRITLDVLIGDSIGACSHIAPIPLMTTMTSRECRFTSATKEMCLAKLYGLCVFVLPLQGEGAASRNAASLQSPAGFTLCRPVELLMSHICYHPRFVQMIANGENPAGVDATMLKAFKKIHGIQYKSPTQEQWMRLPSQMSDAQLCCICMDRETTHRWSRCRHNPEEGWGTVCGECRQQTIVTAKLTGNKRSPCPLCREMGLIIHKSNS